MLSDLGLDCLIYLWKLIRLLLRKTYMHVLAFSDIATSRELLRRQFQLITFSRSSILSSGTYEVISSPKSATKQERRCTYRRKRSVRLNFPQFTYRRKRSARPNFPQFKCGPRAVEPRSSPSSSFTD